MKNKNVWLAGGALALIVTLNLVSTSVDAAPRATQKAATAAVVVDEKPVVMSRSAADFSSSGVKVGLGLSSMTLTNFPAISTTIAFNDTHSLQWLFNIANTSPFQFATGFFYRANVVGSRNSGFHVGGGFQLGTGPLGQGDSFYSIISPQVGLHQCVGAGNDLCLGVDFGPHIWLVDANGVTARFNMGGYPSLMGLNIHYFF